MSFNSSPFLLFFIFVLLVNFFMRNTFTLRYAFLLCASYLFYASWNGYYLLLILISTLLDYVLAIKIEDSTCKDRRKYFLIISMIGNLGLLGIFKYYNFFIGSVFELFLTIGIPFQFSTLQLLLPVGISFYTFQSMSYTIDVYRGGQKAEHDLVRFGLFIAFFPQLVAGPIVRPHDFLPQLNNYCRVCRAWVLSGISLILFGLTKKVIFADFFAQYSDAYFIHLGDSQNLWNALIAIYAFAFQIYFDFSGYTDVAIGAALLLGFKIPRNFYYPYAAKSMNEFWQRWHISLSSWLRDYLYIPLGGYCNKTRNLTITMLLSGLWHGAALHFVVWGGAHGLAMIGEGTVKRWYPYRLPGWIKQLLVFHIVCLGWVMFRVEKLSDLRLVFGSMTNLNIESLSLGMLAALSLCIILYLYQTFHTRLDIRLFVEHQPIWIQASIHATLFTLIITLGEFGKPFIYFQF